MKERTVEKKQRPVTNIILIILFFLIGIPTLVQVTKSIIALIVSAAFIIGAIALIKRMPWARIYSSILLGILIISILFGAITIIIKDKFNIINITLLSVIEGLFIWLFIVHSFNKKVANYYKKD